MGTHLGVLNESYPMNTNMTGFRWFFKDLCVLVIWTKVTSALEVLIKGLQQVWQDYAMILNFPLTNCVNITSKYWP